METLLITMVILLGSCSITLGLFYYSQNKSVLWLITFAITACVSLTGIISAIFPHIYWLSHFTFAFIPLVCLFHCRHYPNWLFFLSIPASLKLFDILWLNEYLLTQVQSWLFYFSYALYEYFTIMLIYCRKSIAKILRLNIHYRRIPQEYLLLVSYSLGIVINLITGIEDLIRNTQFKGELFSQFNPIFFYDIYLFLRFPVNLAESILFVVMAYFAIIADRAKAINSPHI